MAAIKTGSLFIEGPAGQLEAALNIPDQTVTKAAKVLMIISHPHPGFSGTMDNKVITTVERAARELNIQSMRYNFRGVGNSEGPIHSGDSSYENELGDLHAVVRWAQQNLQFEQLYFTGFSFGSAIAANCLFSDNDDDYECRHLTLIAPPVGRYPYPQQFDCPVLVVQGDDDDVVDSNAVVQWAEQQKFDLVRMPTGHFFHGQLISLKMQLQDHWRQQLSI